MNEFQEMIATLLQAILAVGIPIITAFLVNLLKKKTEQVKAEISSELAEKYIDEVAYAVRDAVLCVSQTYVDELKKNDLFVSESQYKALQLALGRTKALLTNEAREFLCKAYGDLNAYLTTKIEAEVKLLK